MIDKLLLIGLGELGGVTLELLARTPEVRTIVVGSRDAERAEKRINVVRLGAMTQGYDPNLRFSRVDLNDTAGTAELIARERPDMILGSATLLSWWMPNLLPPAAAAQIRAAGFGVWLPVHLAPMVDLMKAVQLAGFKGHTLTAPFPDVVNCALGRAGLAPTCGIGNIGEMVPKIQWLAAEQIGAERSRIRVSLVAHHALEKYVFSSGTAPADEAPPFLCRVWLDEKEVTHDLDLNKIIFSPYPRSDGPALHYLTAGTTVQLALALGRDHVTKLHVPAPHGLPGGYPVAVNRDGITVDLPSSALREAITINERSHRWEAIERIEDDGTVIVAEHAARTLREVIGFAPERVSVSTASEQAKELVLRFRNFASQQGVRL